MLLQDWQDWDNHSDAEHSDVPHSNVSHSDSHSNWTDVTHSNWIAYTDTPSSNWDDETHSNVSGEHVDEPDLL